MKNLKLFFLAMLLGTSIIGNSQIVIFNGDTVAGAIIPANDSITIHYCSNITVKITPHDTVGLCYLHSAFPTVGDSILTNGCSYVPLNADTTVMIWYGGYKWVRDNIFGWHYDSNFTSNVNVHLIKKVPSSKICWVTVDSNFQHNVIIWDTTGFTAAGIDSVKIYYYITINTKHLLKTCSRSMTYFVDSTNNPNSGTFKYLLAGVNACGNADTNSAWQTTAWIQQTGSTFTVSSPYSVEGNPTPVSYYILYRDTTGLGNDWDSIFETPGTVLNDPNYSHYPNARYYVAAVLNMPGCSTPSIVHRMESMPANKSKSNRLSNNVSGIAAVTEENSFTVYPVPFKSVFNLTVRNESDVRVYNEIGQMVFRSAMPIGQHQIEIAGPPGLYLLDVNGTYKKIIKE